ncbi:hypothetical protein P3X46_010711 [Hevea brasiliensis]|uniref:NAC domain-containing protein n=1 Tax=Hevea brasiliensis TaxID=3981 RepID=A0ABQ9MEW1_HEVBR|nr:NAC domain-containing protein 83 [Hevea brasiliensis]KAJ9178862.1 hypothetical protein P3X46_010711 [Hevea brasiliensis]
MEKSNLLVNGGMKLPIGYRFHPTDEELLLHYLRRKVFGVPLPASVIPELDVFQADPWSLPGNLKEKRYFFGRKWGNDSENGCKKAAGSGYWKPIGKGRQIVASFSNHVIGMKKTLIFREGKHSNDSTTQWIMHEYRLVGSGTIPNITQIAKMKLGDWVVYQVFQRKRRPRKHGNIISQPSNTNNIQTTHEVMRSSFMEFRMEENSDMGPPQPSSPCSSGVTDEVSSSGLDKEEISSSISFSFHSYMKKT